MDIIERLRTELGAANVLTGGDCAPWVTDWTGKYTGEPLAVVRPASTGEVAAVMKLATETGTPVVPSAGHTGLVGGTHAPGKLVVSVDRMRAVREIRKDARIAVVDAGVILSKLHDAVDEHDLVFPVTFGARGSAMIGGILSTNAGGSNVLRYGNTREQVLGIEVVLPSGEVLDLMSELRKDNSGFDLRDLFVGAEGTLGIITGAVLKLMPKPNAYATAMVALPALSDALDLLNRLQSATGGAVEAFEYMPRNYMERHLEIVEGARPAFDSLYDINIMLEVGATAPRDAEVADDGSVAVVSMLEDMLANMIESGQVLDAVVARTEGQRAEMWKRREDAAEVTATKGALVIMDVAVPLDRVAEFLDRAQAASEEHDPGAQQFVVAHLGDGNVHLSIWPTAAGAERIETILEAVEDVVADMGGSFSAEHGIGLSKQGTMQRRKDPVALDVMKRIKAALDPDGIMNPGKVLPS